MPPEDTDSVAPVEPEPKTLEQMAADVHAAFDDARSKHETKIAADVAAADAGTALDSARNTLQATKDALIAAVNATTV